MQGISLDPSDRWSTPPRVHRLWAGVLLAPVAWAVQLCLAYAMSAFVCAPPRLWPFYVVSAAALGAAGAGGVMAWTLRQEGIREAHDAEDAPNSRARGLFMATGGLMLSGLFALAIVAQAIPLLLLEPCRF